MTLDISSFNQSNSVQDMVNDLTLKAALKYCKYASILTIK